MKNDTAIVLFSGGQDSTVCLLWACHNFKKYYGAYEDLIRDKGVDFILNFLPSGIKFEYIYLCLKNNIKVITDYPIVSNSNDLKYYNKLISSKLIDNLSICH